MYMSGDAGVVRRRDGTFSVAIVLVALLVACFAFCRSAFASTADQALSFASDDVMRGSLKVEKTLPLGKKQGDTSVKDVEFDIYVEHGTVLVNDVWYRGIDLDGDEAVPCATIVTNEDGIAQTPAKYLPYGTYRVVESSVPDGQGFAKIGNAKWSKVVEVHGDGVVADAGKVENPIDPVTVSVHKRDVEQGTAQGGASLAGAVFTVYNRSEAPVEYTKGGQTKVIEVNGVVDTMVTDESGYASLPADCLDYGTYEAVETTPPTGYNLGDIAWASGPVECHEKNTEHDLGTCSNSVIRGGLRVIKFDRQHDAAVPQGDAKLNAEYTIWTRGAKDVIVNGTTYHKDDIVYVGVANEVNGVLSIPANTFPYGTYEVRETKAPYGYLIDSDWSYTFSVSAEGAIYEPSQSEMNKNEPVKGGIRVLKVDAETGESAPQGNGDLANISIDIYNASAMSIFYGDTEVAPGAKVCTIKTRKTSDGYVAETGARDLPMGTYTLRESDVPSSTGYLRNLGWNPTVVIRNDSEIAEALVTE